MNGMCEVCGHPSDGSFKSACLKVLLCMQHARDWDDAVCDMPEWMVWLLADIEFKAVWAAIQGGAATIPQAIEESLRTIRVCDETQRELRPKLKELLERMKTEYESKEKT